MTQEESRPAPEPVLPLTVEARIAAEKPLLGLEHFENWQYRSTHADGSEAWISCPVHPAVVAAIEARAVAAAALVDEDERARPACGHKHFYDHCLLVEGHRAPHLMRDFDYPLSGPRRREYECSQHPVAEPAVVDPSLHRTLCAQCLHIIAAHYTTAEMDLDGRTVGTPYEQCAICVQEDRVESAHAFVEEGECACSRTLGGPDYVCPYCGTKTNRPHGGKVQG